MNNYIIATQFSGYFVFKYFRDLILSNQVSKIYFLQQTEQRKFFIFDLYKVFGFSALIKIIILEIFYRAYFILFYYPLLRGKLKFISDAREIPLTDGDTVLSIGYPRLFPKDMIEQDGVKFLNLHGGILPYQRGLFSPYWAVKFNDGFIGATLHEINAEVDAGMNISVLSKTSTSSDVLVCYKEVLTMASQIVNDYVFKNERHLDCPSENAFKPRPPQFYP